jgi:hypothetical protein
MPQACRTVSPSFRYASIIARGAADPPHTIRVSELTSNLPDCSSGSAPIQMVGTPAASVARSS